MIKHFFKRTVWLNLSKAYSNKHSVIHGWLSTIALAIFVAVAFRWLIFEPFIVPTASMEGTILVGDHILVSKLHYGPRTLSTPLQVPLTHQKIWGTEQPSFVEWISLPMFRLPGFSKIEREDIVVFNYPKEFDLPEDLRTYYVKRCIGMPGDAIEIKEGKIWVNNTHGNKQPNIQTSYFLIGKDELSPEQLIELGIEDFSKLVSGYEVHCNQKVLAQLKQNPLIEEVIPISFDKGNDFAKALPEVVTGSHNNWTIDNLGPLQIPKKGEKITLTPQNIANYGWYIKHYEQVGTVSYTANELLINGTPKKTYEFQSNYYFMMGDNRHNSADSRIWGLVPERFVVGKAVMVWWSMQRFNKNSGFQNVRWDRIGTMLH